MNTDAPLSRYLELQGRARKVRVVLSFASIEGTLGRDLPSSARKYDAWWANEWADTRHVQCRSWLRSRYRVLHVHRDAEQVIF